jgi:hypothetical protein
MSDTHDLDVLIRRLRARAADPERRTTIRQTKLGSEVSALDLGGLLWMGQGRGAMLDEVVAANHAAMMADLMSPASQVRQAQEARAAIGRMTPAERAAMGLSETGWEEVVWGGLGWDPDADRWSG